MADDDNPERLKHETDLIRRQAHFHWLTSKTNGSLHAPDYLTDEQCKQLANGVSNSVIPLCGRKFDWMKLPGTEVRASARRCDTCCKRRMLPFGIGSPHLDNGCRRLMGLATT